MEAEGLSVSQGHWGFPERPAQGDGLRADAERHMGQPDPAGCGTESDAGTGAWGDAPTITGHPEKRYPVTATCAFWPPAWPSRTCHRALQL